MKKQLSFLFSIVFFCCITIYTHAQPTTSLSQGARNVVSGNVVDEIEGFVVSNAMVTTSCTKDQILTDANGNFELTIPYDTCTIYVYFTSYETYEKAVFFTKTRHQVKLNVALKRMINMMERVDIKGEKIDSDPITSTASIVQVDPKSMENKNLTNAPDLINQLPGVAVVDNEPQIRGGSGFSSGMGSRVMILLDNMPFLRPDAGRPMWSFIPMENVSEIEVLKGAASVVHGSSALTGSINVLTAYPNLKPTTKVMVQAGVYDSPSDKYKKSWGKVPPFKWGASFLHSRIIKKNFDLVLGGEYYDDQSYLGPEMPISEGKTGGKLHEGKYEMRARFNFGTRYRATKVKGLVASLNGNFMYSENAQSFFWYDSDTNMYRSYKGSLSVFKDFTFYVDPVITYTMPDGGVFAFRNRVIYSNNKEKKGAQSALSVMAYDELQYAKMFDKIGLRLVTGIMNLYSYSNGPVFNGEFKSNVPGIMTSDNFSIYAQLEKKFFKNKNLSIVVGGRWEFYKLAKEFCQKPIFRAGINYQLPFSPGTSFRASFGQGYRYPSIGERFISISVGNYGFYPNPDLKPETSWNAEIGIAQPWLTPKVKGLFDIAAYYQQFDNYIEFAFGSWGNTGRMIDEMGFKYLNTGPAFITGVDMSFTCMGEICKQVSFQFMASYTYSLPKTKNKSGVYYVDGQEEYTYNRSASDPSQGILKYRIQHTAKADLTFTFWKKLSFNVGCTYYSSMRNVDKMFFDYDVYNENNSSGWRSILEGMGTLPFTGYTYYFNTHKKGSFILDMGLTYNILKDLKVSFVVKNILNNEYTLRPMYLEPPRTYNLQIIYGL